MVKTSSSWLKGFFAVLKKDLQSEFRTRYTLSTLFMFALTTLVIVSFSLGVMEIEPGLHAALLWIIVFFASMAGMARSFVKEEEAGTRLALRLSGRLEFIFFGKLLFNLLMLMMLLLVIGPLYLIFMLPALNSYFVFSLVLFLGALGISGATTILSALVARAASRGTLLPVLAFPILLPILFTSINATRLLFSGSGFGDIQSDLLFTFSYSGIIITVSFLLFGFVWEE